MSTLADIILGALFGVVLWCVFVAAPTSAFMAAGGSALVPDTAEWLMLAALCAGVPVSGLVGAAIAYRAAQS